MGLWGFGLATCCFLFAYKMLYIRSLPTSPELTERKCAIAFVIWRHKVIVKQPTLLANRQQTADNTAKRNGTDAAVKFKDC